MSFDKVGREDVQASTGKTVEMFVFMAFLCTSGGIASDTYISKLGPGSDRLYGEYMVW